MYYPHIKLYAFTVFGYLESLIPENFTIPGETYYEWYYGSCAVVYWNLDCCEYEVCYADLVSV